MSSRTRSSVVTHGIRVTVQSQYIPEQSDSASQRYVFAYTVRIENEGKETLHLRTRHWIITHADGHVEEVRGPGVVGEEPVLEPGHGFQYTSGCVLRTPRGTMRGSYQMERTDGSSRDVTIEEFALEMPYSLN